MGFLLERFRLLIIRKSLGEGQLTLVEKSCAARAGFVGLLLMLSSCSDQPAGMAVNEDADVALSQLTTRTYDFNEWLDSEYATELDNLMTEYGLTDIWRVTNPDTKRFTWRKITKNGITQSRLDYFL